MRQVPQRVLAYFFPPRLTLMLIIVALAQTAYYMMYPILTFLFFAHGSPLFPVHTSDAHRSWLYGLTLSSTQIGGIVSNTFIISLSDRYGRKFVFQLAALGVMLFALGTLLALHFRSPYLLMASVFLGSCLYVMRPAALAMTGDQSSASSKLHNMALLQCFIAIGATLGPILGGHFSAQRFWPGGLYHGSFWVAMFVICVTLGLALLLKESLSTKDHTPHWYSIFADIRILLHSKTVLLLLLILVLSQLSWGIYYEFIPAIMKQTFHYNVKQVGWFVGLIAFWLILTTGFIIQQGRRWLSLTQLMRLSVLLVLCGLLLSLLASETSTRSYSHYMMWVGAIPIAMGDVMLYSLIVTALSNAVDKRFQGRVMASVYIVITTVWAINGVIGGYLTGLTANATLWFAPLGCCGLAFLLFFTRTPTLLKKLGE